jgi:hypothetical protein
MFFYINAAFNPVNISDKMRIAVLSLQAWLVSSTTLLPCTRYLLRVGLPFSYRGAVTTLEALGLYGLAVRLKIFFPPIRHCYSVSMLLADGRC